MPEFGLLQNTVDDYLDGFFVVAIMSVDLVGFVKLVGVGYGLLRLNRDKLEGYGQLDISLCKRLWPLCFQSL